MTDQLSAIEDELYAIDRKKNVKMDVIQETLRVVRDIGTAYREASPLLKRLYLGLFWEEFRIADKVIVEARKAPILSALEAIGSVLCRQAHIESHTGNQGLRIFGSNKNRLGRLERIELSMSVPQTDVLPLNYSRHEFLTFPVIMVYQEMAIMTKPGKIL